MRESCISMEKAIVFGGSGFLGSHVADELTAKGYEVTIFDLHTSPFLKSNQQMILGNILDKDLVKHAISRMDYVFNFAGLADINEAKDKPEQTVNLNILGNVNLLEAAKEAKIKRFVYASTIYVYSESGSFYRASKQAAEKYTELYNEKYKLPYTILRYGSIYGRRADHRNIIYRFIKDALSKGEITYPGTGDELREYIHAADAGRATVEILKPEYENSHYVITGHNSYRVGDVMRMISEILDNKPKIIFDNKNYEAHYNITPYAYKPKFGKKLVVNPFVDMGQGILDCIEEHVRQDHDLYGEVEKTIGF